MSTPTEEKAWQDGIQLAENRVMFAIRGADYPGLAPVTLKRALEGLGDAEATALRTGYHAVMDGVRREVQRAGADKERWRAGLPPMGFLDE